MAEKSKKKVLYIITKSVWGGAGKYVYDLAVNLPKEKFEVFVAAGGKNELAQKLTRANIPYFEIKSFQRNINFIKEIFSYFEILPLLLKIKPDIIHVNSSKAGGIAGMAALDYKILTFNFKMKTIFTAHGWAFHENRPFWQIILIKLLSALTCFYYSKIICVSEYDRLSAIKNFIAPAKKLITIHNGINDKEYKFLPKDEARQKLETFGLKVKADEGLIGTTGEFTNNKGQEYLISAAKKLVDDKYQLKTAIIGWGELKEKLEKKIKRENLEKDVFIINSFPDVAACFKAFDIFVLPSLKEGLPYTLLEAGLAELPIIATKTGGVPEIITDGREGLLAEKADSGNLAEKIEAMIENPKNREFMSANLQQKVVSDFSIEKMLNATIATYEQNAANR